MTPVTQPLRTLAKPLLSVRIELSLRLACLAACLSLTSSKSAHCAELPQLELAKGDRIAVLGNGMADRMQHDGWLETYLQSRFPTHQLVVRNLGFTGDELTVRLRSSGFGSPEQWLQRTKANVVFACFGYNESFRDAAGIEKFKKDLAGFVKETRTPKDVDIERQLVLISPAAYEDLGNRLLPAPTEPNQRLAAYSQAMREVAAELKVPFVDLHQPTLSEMKTSSDPLTTNGVHFNEAGNRVIASIIDTALFGDRELPTSETLAQLRESVCDKNFYWFQRYRTTDGYSIFGGRKGTGGSRWTPNNEKVMQREMEILDAMTANRDQRIWAIAQGKDLTVDDSNTPPSIPVASNRPGPLGDGSYPFLGGEEAIERMTVPKGLAVDLFASEEQFPDLQNPVQAAVDTKGRLWVAVWPSYPHWNPKDEMNDKLLIFEDTDGDGHADKCKVFADKLHNPTGFEFYNGGVYVAQVPDIWFLKDTDGDDVADVRERVIGGIDSADTHHSINSFTLGPGGGIYFQEGLFHHTQVETPHGPPVRVKNAGVFRYDPRSLEFDCHASYGFANPHGHVFTYWGNDIVHDGTSAVPMFGPAISVRADYPNKHRGAPPIYDRRTRPCSATAILSSSHFPEAVRDNLLVCNVIGEQGVLQYELHEDGAGIKGVETEPLLMSTDPNFRPVDLEVGEDGAVYVLDWQNPLIGHLQHNLRDSNRDHLHGRIYRVRHGDRELLDGPAIAGQSIQQLLQLLQRRDNGIRYRAKIELSTHTTADVISACEEWITSLDSQATDYEHHLLEGLWVHQHHHSINEPLLRKLLASTDHRVRTAAAHVLRAWREDIADANTLVDQLVHDEHPSVRLVGVLICSDIDSSNAAELALEAAKMPRGKFLDYVLTETTRTLAPLWKQTLADGNPFCSDNPNAISYLLRCSSPEDMLKIATSEQVLAGITSQPDIKPNVRFNALRALAKKRNSKPLDVLLDMLAKATPQDDSASGELVDLLQRFKPETLTGTEDQFTALATTATNADIREGALAALASIAKSADQVWASSSKSTNGMRDLLGSVRRIPDRKVRQTFFGPVRRVMLDPKKAVNSDVSAKDANELVKAAIDAMAHIPRKDATKLDDLITFLESNRHRPNAVATLGKINPRHWTAEFATRLIGATSGYLATVEASRRASGDAFDELQLAIKVADVLPSDKKRTALDTLNGFIVRSLKLGTIPHRMSYDQQKLVVRTGEPVQLMFENQDNMPHNFVVTKPGFLADIGKKAEAEATDPQAIAREYVPRSSRVILSSRLLQPQEEQTLDFRAPKEPGIYPFVCTYPGHWRRMYGALVVVNDVDAYEAEPTEYLAANAIEPKDELLKFNRPLHNWTLAELQPLLDRLGEGQNFHRGTQLFEAASCAACHSVQEGQRRFAPDLTKLDPKRKPADILRSMVEPSKEIEEKYQMSKILVDTGKVVLGLVIEEADDEVILMTDPLSNCEPTILAADEIEQRSKSDLSLMPAGLLDRFTEDEILELCAFIVARGDKDAPVYQGSSTN